jgi:SAM-dependent methyltransferase
MTLPDWLHCPDCQGRLALAALTHLRCTVCDRDIPIVDGIADLIGDQAIPASDPHRWGIDPAFGEAAIGDLLARIRSAAGTRWPEYLGQLLEIGCGIGQMTRALVSGQPMRGLLAVDTAMQNLRACRHRLSALAEAEVVFATLSGHRNAIRDAVADTVFGTDVLGQIGDLRVFLAMVYRALKPRGRAWFIIPNRRYRQAICQALAEALVQRFARDGAWPDEIHVAVGILARSRRLLAHQEDAAFLAGLEQKRLFDSEMLEDLGREVGFATAEAIPLDPDPVGSQSMRRLLAAANLSEAFITATVPLAASAGQPYFSLLGRQDASAATLLWLTKAAGPDVRVFAAQPKPPSIGFAGAETVVGGPPPRWSIELLASDTPQGVALKVGGWCLANTDVKWLRITLDGATRHVPVWRPRPDVHEVMNRAGLYHPLNALCSGLDAEILFDGLHPAAGQCPLHLDVVLANGMVLRGPAPSALRMHEPVVVNQ